MPESPAPTIRTSRCSTPEILAEGVTPFPPSGVFVGLTGRDDPPMLHKILPIIAGLALLAPAVASADDLGQTFHPSPIRAYRGNALWSTAPQGTKTFTLMLNGQPLPVTSAKAPVDADVSRGPSGAPTVVVARADGLYLLDGSTLKRVVKRTGAHAPTIWGDRIAWVEGHDTIYTATIGQSRVRRVPSPVTGARISEVKLFGQELAISLDTGRTLNDVQAWLQELDGSRKRLVRAQSSGEAGRQYVGLVLRRRRVLLRADLRGDPSGCPGHGTAYRYASGKLTKASVPLDLAGFAQAGGQSYWVTENYGSCVDINADDAPCLVQKAALTFN